MSGVNVRALASDAEVEALMGLAVRAFSSATDPDAEAVEWRDQCRAAPWHRPEQLRGAIREGRLVGGYEIAERWLRIGQARLLTGCIGMVVVDPAHRKLGIGRALLEDAIAFAEAERHALLLLDGIPGFYDRFGFADVFDATRHAFSRAAALGLETSPYSTRPATVDDAAALLDLYRRHVGAFDRTLEEQRFRLGGSGTPRTVAVDASGRVRGYMLPPRGDQKERAEEVVAEEWPAALALLHHHANLAGGDELTWAIPPHAPLLAWLRDRLPLRSTRTSTPNADWMARVGHMPTLVEAAGLPAEAAELDLKVLVQLLFGFRPAAAVDPGLERIFPFGRFWIPASDSF